MSSKKRAMFPGTFDPITFGHISIIERSLSIVDEVVVAVYKNERKAPMFTVDQRVGMVREALLHLGARVKTIDFNGLLVDLVREYDIQINIRGVRCSLDFEYEMRMSHINNRLCPSLETIFLPSADIHRYTSSSFVREIAALGGNVDQFVPDSAVRALKGLGSQRP